jgi:hypothetical protein
MQRGLTARRYPVQVWLVHRSSTRQLRSLTNNMTVNGSALPPGGSALMEHAQATESADRRATAKRLRFLTVGASGSEAELAALAHVREWAGAAGVETEHVPDLPRAIRRLALDRWNLVFAALSDRPAEELAWWADVLRRSEGAPRLVALVQRPSMGLALQSQKLGVLDLLSLSLRFEDFSRVLESLRGTEMEEPIAFPPVDAEMVGAHALVGQHPAQ